MPWHVARRDTCPAAKPWAVIRDADPARPERIVACHQSRTDAERQMSALYANEPATGRAALTVPVQWKTATGGDPGELEGYASVFGNVDQGGDVVLPGAFKRTLAHWKTSKLPLPLIADHDLSTEGVIGSVVDANEDGTGLRIRARFSATKKAQDIRRKMIEGHLKGMSFTYEAVKHYMGTQAGKSVRYLQELRLFETTVTPFPMNELALASAKAVSNTPWSQFSQADYTDEQWAAACLIDTGQGEGKQRYSLPVKEPSGAVNRNAVHAAAGRLNQVQASPDKRAAAARALVRMYRADLGEDPPEHLMRMAGMATSAASADLREAMHKVLEIGAEPLRKVAADALLDAYLTIGEPEDEAPGPADEPDPTADSPAPTPPAEGPEGTPDNGLTPSEYADQIAARGMADGSPADLDNLEARIRAALGRAAS